jgi:hypothetical protein
MKFSVIFPFCKIEEENQIKKEDNNKEKQYFKNIQLE